MNHFPIRQQVDADGKLEFSHFMMHAPAGLWKPERTFILPHIKINIFVGGEFGVFCRGQMFHPSRGDLCVFSPKTLHYGQILKHTHLNYYQLDIGLRAFDGIPGGAELLQKLVQSTANLAFLRPEGENADRVFALCEQTERAVTENNLPLAFAKCVELVNMLHQIYQSGGKAATFFLSQHTVRTVRYIEEHYAEAMSLRQLAEREKISPSYLSRCFQKDIGVGVHAYINQLRGAKAVVLLQTHSVADTAELCGFGDASHFISVFKTHMLCSPAQYKRSQEN